MATFNPVRMIIKINHHTLQTNHVCAENVSLRVRVCVCIRSTCSFFQRLCKCSLWEKIVSRTPDIQCYCRGKGGLGKNLWLLEENLRNILLEPQIKAIFCLPPLTHATDVVRLCTGDKCNYYCMSCDLQMRSETLAHPSTRKAACQLHSQPVPYTILQFTPT